MVVRIKPKPGYLKPAFRFHCRRFLWSPAAPFRSY